MFRICMLVYVPMYDIIVYMFDILENMCCRDKLRVPSVCLSVLGETQTEGSLNLLVWADGVTI